MTRDDYLSEIRDYNARLVQLYEYVQYGAEFVLPGAEQVLPALANAIAAAQTTLLQHGKLMEAAE